MDGNKKEEKRFEKLLRKSPLELILIPLMVGLVFLLVTPYWEKYSEEKIDRFTFAQFLEEEM